MTSNSKRLSISVWLNTGGRWINRWKYRTCLDRLDVKIPEQKTGILCFYKRDIKYDGLLWSNLLFTGEEKTTSLEENHGCRAWRRRCEFLLSVGNPDVLALNLGRVVIGLQRAQKWVWRYVTPCNQQFGRSVVYVPFLLWMYRVQYVNHKI